MPLGATKKKPKQGLERQRGGLNLNYECESCCKGQTEGREDNTKHEKMFPFERNSGYKNSSFIVVYTLNPLRVSSAAVVRPE